MMLLAQLLMLGTLILMITGRTPLYLTAILGATVSALVAGFPLTGKENITIAKLIIGGMNPVIADMTGVLLFIGVMHATGFLNVIIRDIVRVGNRLGGGPGICTAASLAAGGIGALTGFTQPVITGVVAGPAATKMGVSPNDAAGSIAHAGHFGNFAGFTHPTQVAVIATAGIGFGMINVYGAIISLSIMAIAFWRMKRRQADGAAKLSDAEMQAALAEFAGKDMKTPSWAAFAPFGVLVAGFVCGLPVFLVGTLAAVSTMLLAKAKPAVAEAAMMEGVQKIAVPLVATIGFLYMSGVIKSIGIVDDVASLLGPWLSVAPVFIMLLVSALTGLLTQSNAASAAIIVPFLAIVLKTGADPMAASVAALAGSSIMQYFLTGGPVAALSTVIPVIPGSELMAANKFQRPNQLFGLAVAFVVVTGLVVL